MKLSEIKKHLNSATGVTFQLPNGSFVPEHFHVTEIGVITKNFIDCGGSVRKESVVNFQLWDANDFEHRLKAQKLLNIIALSEKILGLEDLEIEVEYQDTTIGKYDLEYNGETFLLLNKQTACLALDQCCPPQENQKPILTAVGTETNTCTPDGGCC